MKNPLLSLLPGLLATLLAALPGSPASAAGGREDEAFFAAISANPAALQQLLAERFVYRTSRGPVIGKRALIDELRSGRTRVSAAEISEYLTVTERGTRVGTGIVTLQVLTAEGTQTSRSRFTHVWVREATGWRLLFRESSIL